MFPIKEKKQIEKAAALLSAGALVAIPTETVYGLAANAFSEQAVQKIFKTKNRPQINPLILHIKGIEALDQMAQNIPDAAYKLASQFWPGPLTLVLEKKPHISSMITAGKATVGIRVPKHPVALALLKSLDFPLVAPSANRSNHISPTIPLHVKHSLGKDCPFILEGGACELGLESTILGFVENDIFIYRHGAITKEVLEQFLGHPLLEKSNAIAPESPGMFLKHYSPNTPLVIFGEPNTPLTSAFKRVGYLRFKEKEVSALKSPQIVLSLEGSLEQAAQNLYKALYELDNLHLDLIVAEKVPNYGVGIAINDKLLRAAKK